MENNNKNSGEQSEKTWESGKPNPNNEFIKGDKEMENSGQIKPDHIKGEGESEKASQAGDQKQKVGFDPENSRTKGENNKIENERSDLRSEKEEETARKSER